MRFGVEPKATGGGVWICGMMLENGTKPTDWTPAPEDVQDQINSIQNPTFDDSGTTEGINSFTDFMNSVKSKMNIFQFFKNFKAGMKYVLHTGRLVNNAVTTAEGFALDARMGKVLQDQITAQNNNLNTGLTELKKSVADGKNLIGNVVGGNQDSTFQVLANNAQSIKTSMNDLNNQLHAMTMDRNNWMNIANSRIVYRFSNGQLGSQTFAFSKFMRLIINDSSVSEDRLSNYHFLFYRRANRVFIMLPYQYYSAAPPIYHRIIKDGNYSASSLSNDQKTNSFLLSEGVEYEIKGYFKTYASGTDLTGSIFIKSVSGNINVTKVNLNKTAYYGAWTC